MGLHRKNYKAPDECDRRHSVYCSSAHTYNIHELDPAGVHLTVRVDSLGIYAA